MTRRRSTTKKEPEPQPEPQPQQDPRLVLPDDMAALMVDIFDSTAFPTINSMDDFMTHAIRNVAQNSKSFRTWFDRRMMKENTIHAPTKTKSMRLR